MASLIIGGIIVLVVGVGSAIGFSKLSNSLSSLFDTIFNFSNSTISHILSSLVWVAVIALIVFVILKYTKVLGFLDKTKTNKYNQKSSKYNAEQSKNYAEKSKYDVQNSKINTKRNYDNYEKYNKKGK